MNKAEFLQSLDQRLKSLGESDRQRSAHYFAEIIEDRMEEGMSEEDAVADLESLDDIVEGILNEKEEAQLLAAQSSKKRRFPLWLTILLLILGSPVWLPLLLTVISVATTLYLCLWILSACVYLAAVALILSGVAGFFAVFSAATVSGAPGAVFLAGAALLCLGGGILLFFPATWFAKWVVTLTKGCVLKLSEMFTGKGVKR
ncbi:MAG TPA: DUF1700 domain-containing protein [Clostridiales bacterium]|nr:DUF1700 domain-containing protein [Clostridiales bacterium]